jgi:hypothetical protein
MEVQMHRASSLLRILGCGLFIFVLSGVTVAQFNAGVQGSVTDSTGALVPEAIVTLTNRATNQTAQVTASGEGVYRFSSLQPGEYTLKAEKTGFGTTTMNIVVRAESVQGFDIVLNLGDVAETVTITDAAEQVLQTENANIDKVITTQEVLPAANRARSLRATLQLLARTEWSDLMTGGPTEHGGPPVGFQLIY